MGYKNRHNFHHLDKEDEWQGWEKLSQDYNYNYKRNLVAEVASRYVSLEKNGLTKRDRAAKRLEWKRDLSGRANGTIDPWYGCTVFEEMLTYAINFTFPWTLSQPSGAGLNLYNLPDALFPPIQNDASVFQNDNRTRRALHAPTSKNWEQGINYPFGSNPNGGDPGPEPMVFLTDLATNMTLHNVSVVLYVGNDDGLMSHRGTELVIQNTTFGGIQGFSVKPSTPWTDDEGNFAGIVHQERGWTFALFNHAGHLVPQQKPAAAFTFIREFVLGNNKTGLVLEPYDIVEGGQDPEFVADVLPGQDEIYYGPGVTLSTFVFPSATIAAWRSFIGQPTPSPST